jgi:hypothetical protein
MNCGVKATKNMIVFGLADVIATVPQKAARGVIVRAAYPSFNVPRLAVTMP